RESIAQARTRLTPADGIRMLGLLTQAETSIRRSANPRLVVETLLLRWTVMDRTIDLEEVLKSGSTSTSTSGNVPVPAGNRAVGPASPVPMREPTPAARREQAAPAAPRPAPAIGSLSVESLTSIWPEIVLRGKERGQLLAAVLETLQPVA